MYIYIFFCVYNGIIEKKNINEKKMQQKRILATAQLYCEKKKICIAILGFVLQEKGLSGRNCIVT